MSQDLFAIENKMVMINECQDLSLLIEKASRVIVEVLIQSLDMREIILPCSLLFSSSAFLSHRDLDR